MNSIASHLDKASPSRPLPLATFPVSATTPATTKTIAGGSSSGSAASVTLSATARAAVSGEIVGKKDFKTVANDARATLDAGYKSLGNNDDQVYMYGTETEWKTVFALDRRSLYAIRSNEGGQFTVKEQDIAKSLMARQEQVAAGLDTPAGKLGLNGAQGAKNAVRFLDNVSDQEKSSFDWAKARAVAQFTYESAMHQDGEEPEKLDSTNPVARMIKSAIDTLRQLDDPSKTLEDMPRYKQAQQLFALQEDGRSNRPIDVTV